MGYYCEDAVPTDKTTVVESDVLEVSVVMLNKLYNVPPAINGSPLSVVVLGGARVLNPCTK